MMEMALGMRSLNNISPQKLIFARTFVAICNAYDKRVCLQKNLLYMPPNLEFQPISKNNQQYSALFVLAGDELQFLDD
jgi:hypothetical protein